MRKKLRSTLTILGVFIAITTIFVLISLSLGLDAAIKEQFRKLGSDKFFIMPKGQAGAAGAGGAVQLTTKDVDVVRKVRGVDYATYMNVGNVKIEYKDKTRYYIVIGLPTDGKAKELELIFEAMGVGIDEGRMLKNGDKKKILIGYNYKYGNLFNRPVRVGDRIKLNDVEFEVIGVLESVGNPSDDQQVYISNEEFKELFNSGDRADTIYVQVKSGEDLNSVAENTKKSLMNHRDVTEKTIDFDIMTPEEILKSFSTILNIVTVFLLGVGGISLFVGGVGIANTMFTSVLERVKEIGVMKAIGARNSDVLMIFVIESGILGLIGGVIGIIFGIIIGKIIEYIAINSLATTLLKVVFPWYLIVGCLLFAFTIGIISGFLPARQASKIRPADTLRYE